MNIQKYKSNNSYFTQEEIQHAEAVMALDVDDNYNVITPPGTDPYLAAERLSIAKWQRPDAYKDPDYIYSLMMGSVNPIYIEAYNQFIVNNVTNEFAPGAYISTEIEIYRLLYETICEQTNFYESSKTVPNLFEYFYDYLYTATCLSYETAFRNEKIDCNNEELQKDKQLFIDSAGFHMDFLNQPKYKKEKKALSEILQTLQEIMDYITNKALNYGRFFRTYDSSELSLTITFEEFASDLPENPIKFEVYPKYTE